MMATSTFRRVTFKAQRSSTDSTMVSHVEIFSFVADRLVPSFLEAYLELSHPGWDLVWYYMIDWKGEQV